MSNSATKSFIALGTKLRRTDVPTSASVRRFSSVDALRANRATSNVDGLFRINVERGVFTAACDPKVELQVLDSKPKDRHLLLMARVPTYIGQKLTGFKKEKFLCGHDERDWFVAAVPAKATTVITAKEALRPAAVTERVIQAGVSKRKEHKHRNAAFVRQGEWFFTPEPNLKVNPAMILKNEPLVRADNRGGKPHMVQELYREGGQTVYVHPRLAPFGQVEPPKDMAGWRLMKRNPAAFARGSVRHADHATVTFKIWHRIHMNTESRRQSLGFLD